MSNLKMPDRRPTDGLVHVTRDHADGTVSFNVTTDGETHGITCSEHNAWRLLGLLSFMLGVPLSAAAQKAVKF